MATVWPLVIIGCGASGMLAALGAVHEKPGLNVLILEKEARAGRKLLATGNGRCNMTHRPLNIAAYRSTDEDWQVNRHTYDASVSAPSFVRTALDHLNPDALLSQFDRWGLLWREDEEGRVYPRTNLAATVVRILENALSRARVCIRFGAEVVGIQPDETPLFGMSRVDDHGRFRLTLRDGQTIFADSVVLACGGMAAPQLGGSYIGYVLGEQMGHRSTPCFPTLTPLLTDAGLQQQQCEGVRFRGAATLWRDKQFLSRQEGEFQITSYGLSGIAAFELSRKINVTDLTLKPDEESRARQRSGQRQAAKKTDDKVVAMLRKPLRYSLTIDFLPEFSDQAISRTITSRLRNQGELRAGEWLLGLVHDKLADWIPYEILGLGRDRIINDASFEHIQKLVQALKRYPCKVTGLKGWDYAQVTSGGLRLAEFDSATLESTKHKGLYACGELLDVDAATGGHNLQWAWSSGWLAGKSAVRSDAKPSIQIPDYPE